MTDSKRSPASDAQGAEVDEVGVRESKGLPIVWIIPLVAVAIGGWLWIQALRERGPTIEIRFATAEGLVTGKTAVKFKELEVGTVTAVEFSTDLKGVVATVDLEPGSDPYLRTSTRFWVVRPRIGASGVSGLGTLLSGAYIGMEPGTAGDETLKFTGLELPPMHAADAGGLKVQLTCATRGSHSAGTPVYYSGANVGAVERVRFSPDGNGFEIDVYIEPQYKHFITANSRFWDASGLTAKMGANGIEVHVQSLDALLIGGIAFAVPEGLEPGPPAEADATYTLFPDREVAGQAHETKERWIVYFDESVRGLVKGAPVEFRGLRVGEVLEIRATIDIAAENLWIPVVIEGYTAAINVRGLDPDLSILDRQRAFVKMGLCARLKSGSLLTGAKYIDIDFVSDETPRLAGLDDTVFELPTLPSSGVQFTEAMERLPDIVANLDRVTGDLADLLGSEQTNDILDSIHRTAGEAEALVANINAEVEPLATSLRGTLADTDTLLASVTRMVEAVDAERPELEARIRDALTELTAGLRSLRTLTDYLERHPESLLKGKGGE